MNTEIYGQLPIVFLAKVEMYKEHAIRSNHAIN